MIDEKTFFTDSLAGHFPANKQNLRDYLNLLEKYNYLELYYVGQDRIVFKALKSFKINNIANRDRIETILCNENIKINRETLTTRYWTEIRNRYLNARKNENKNDERGILSTSNQ